jgi:hypothetical protein
MIIDDFDIINTIFAPFKTDSPVTVCGFSSAVYWLLDRPGETEMVLTAVEW